MDLTQCDWARARLEIEQGQRMRRACWPANDFVMRDPSGEREVQRYVKRELEGLFMPTMGDQFAEDWQTWS